jgi:hypothetical protein
MFMVEYFNRSVGNQYLFLFGLSKFLWYSNDIQHARTSHGEVKFSTHTGTRENVAEEAVSRALLTSAERCRDAADVKSKI